MDTFYRERANGRWEYWTYSEGRRIPISGEWALRQIQRGSAELVTVR